jgi:hypothetical protein
VAFWSSTNGSDCGNGSPLGPELSSPLAFVAWSFSTNTSFSCTGVSVGLGVSPLSLEVWIFSALCTLVYLIADFSLTVTSGLFSSFFFFFLLSSFSPWSFDGASWALGSCFFFFFLIRISRSSLDAGSSFFFFLAAGNSRSSLDSGSSFSFSGSSLTEFPLSPPCEVETAACFLFLTKGTSFSASSS